MRRFILILALSSLLSYRAAAADPIIFNTDANNIEAVAFSPDSKSLAALGSRAVHLWDLATGKELWSAKSEARYIGSLAFSPNGKQLLIGGYGPLKPEGGSAGIASVWDATTGKVIRSFEVADQVEAVTFCSDGVRVAVGGRGGLVRVLDAKTGDEVFTLKGHDGDVRGLASEGMRLLSASQDGTVRVWNLQTGKQAAVLECGEGRVLCVATDGKRAVVGYEEDLVVWDLKTGKKEHRLEGHTGPVQSVAVRPEGKTALSTATLFGGEVIVWDLATGKALRNSKTSEKERVYRVAYSPDGKKVAAGCYGGVIRVYDADDK